MYWKHAGDVLAGTRPVKLIVIIELLQLNNRGKKSWCGSCRKHAYYGHGHHCNMDAVGIEAIVSWSWWRGRCRHRAATRYRGRQSVEQVEGAVVITLVDADESAPEVFLTMLTNDNYPWSTAKKGTS
jgi:hypothetical protein